MKRSTATVLITIGSTMILMVVIFLFACGYFYYKFQVKNADARSSGEQFGQTTDVKGCVAESVRQFGSYQDDSFLIRLDQFHIAHFTSGCLLTSKPTPKFCEGVPPKGDSWLTRLQWTVQQCKDAGLRDGGPCNEIFKEVIIFCSTKASEADD